MLLRAEVDFPLVPVLGNISSLSLLRARFSSAKNGQQRNLASHCLSADMHVYIFNLFNSHPPNPKAAPHKNLVYAGDKQFIPLDFTNLGYYQQHHTNESNL